VAILPYSHVGSSQYSKSAGKGKKDSHPARNMRISSTSEGGRREGAEGRVRRWRGDRRCGSSGVRGCRDSRERGESSHGEKGSTGIKIQVIWAAPGITSIILSAVKAIFAGQSGPLRTAGFMQDGRVKAVSCAISRRALYIIRAAGLSAGITKPASLLVRRGVTLTLHQAKEVVGGCRTSKIWAGLCQREGRSKSQGHHAESVEEHF